MIAHEINTNALGSLSEEEFMRFCMDNPHLRIERSAEGNIIIMPPTYSETGFLNSNVLIELGNWNKKTKVGYVFDSSTGFTLPSTAVRSPDVSLVLKEKWEALSQDEKRKFAHLCPDFVIEIVSPTDNLQTVQSKMMEWMEQGASLGWLLDFENKKAWIYKGGTATEHPFDKPLAGSYPVEGFEISLPDMLE